MTPALYRYKDSESVIKPMDGYTPGAGWEPLYTQKQIDEAVAEERERCVEIVMVELDNNGQACAIADAIRKGE